MHKLTIPFLMAASDRIYKVEELVSKLARQLSIPVQELFYFWMSSRSSEIKQRGIIKNTNWGYFFHGLECDIWHTKDERFLFVEFGPNGRIDTFSGFSVSAYVYTSKPPWPEYKELKKFLFGKNFKGPQIDVGRDNFSQPEFEWPPSIDTKQEAIDLLMDELETHNFIEGADPKLYKLRERLTTTDDKGPIVIDLAKTTTEREAIDAMVCRRWIISSKGRDQIK